VDVFTLEAHKGSRKPQRSAADRQPLRMRAQHANLLSQLALEFGEERQVRVRLLSGLSRDVRAGWAYVNFASCLAPPFARLSRGGCRRVPHTQPALVARWFRRGRHWLSTLFAHPQTHTVPQDPTRSLPVWGMSAPVVPEQTTDKSPTLLLVIPFIPHHLAGVRSMLRCACPRLKAFEF
jgi:hypothetical protein